MQTLLSDPTLHSALAMGDLSMLFAMYKVVQFIINIVQFNFKMLFNIKQNITFNLCQNIEQYPSVSFAKYKGFELI